MADAQVQVEGLDEALQTILSLGKKIDSFGERVVKAAAERLCELLRDEYFLATELATDSGGNDISVTYTAEGKSAVVTASGKDVLFIEFGTGLPAQSDPHPALDDWQMSEPMGAGTWSEKYGSGHWNDPNGWFYRDDAGNLIRTKGHGSGKCGYNALKQLEEEIPSIFEKVWNEVTEVLQ